MHHEPGFFAEPANWVVLAFFLFFLLFGRKLWAALTGMLDQRAVSVRAELDEAARLKSEAEAMLKQAEATRLKAQSDAKAMIEGAVVPRLSRYNSAKVTFESMNAITELSAYFVIFAESGVRVSHCHHGCLRMNSASL